MCADWRYTAKLLGIRVTGWKARAFNYLEANGMTFCGHFGTDNAIEIARKHWRDRRKAKQSKTRFG